MRLWVLDDFVFSQLLSRKTDTAEDDDETNGGEKKWILKHMSVLL